jgi:hypothetical protein
MVTGKSDCYEAKATNRSTTENIPRWSRQQQDSLVTLVEPAAREADPPPERFSAVSNAKDRLMLTSVTFPPHIGPVIENETVST